MRIVQDKTQIMKQFSSSQANQETLDFYQKFSQSFSQTRTNSWTGWKIFAKKRPDMIENSDSVIDIACGNGRFGQFMAQTNKNIVKYIACDANTSLLQECARRNQQLFPHSIYIELDIFSQLMKNQEVFVSNLSKNLNFSDQILIGCFGFWHHLPSHLARVKFLSALKTIITTHQGMILISVWQCKNNARLMRNGHLISIEEKPDSSGDSNDYLLTWKGDQQTFRYCHHSSDEEFQKYCMDTGLTIEDIFPGKDSDTDNIYYVLI